MELHSFLGYLTSKGVSVDEMHDVYRGKTLKMNSF